MRALRPEKILSRTEHRPYPVPAGPWALSMSWHDLLFMHWPVPEGALRPWIPSPLSLDTFDGSAWLGITPFRMSGVPPLSAEHTPSLQLSGTQRPHLRHSRGQTGHLVLQPRRGQPHSRPACPRHLQPALLRREDDLPIRRPRGSLQERPHAPGCDPCAIRGSLPAGGIALQLPLRDARTLPDRTLLSLQREREGQRLPRRHPSPSLAPAASRG